jgi:DNA-binding HxlR family transcriptional regulator
MYTSWRLVYMGNAHGDADNYKSQIQKYITKESVNRKVSFGDLHEEFCIKRKKDNKKETPLMSRRTLAKYLNELIEENRIEKRHDKKTLRVYYVETPYAISYIMKQTDKWHYEYLKSIKTLKEAKVYCEILYRASKVKSRPRSQIIEVDMRAIE